MSILEQANNVEIKETPSLNNTPTPTKEFGVYELCSYFDVKEMDKENMNKIETIYNWAKQGGGDIYKIVRDIDIRLGVPNGISKIDKIYTYVALDNEERHQQELLLKIKENKNKMLL